MPTAKRRRREACTTTSSVKVPIPTPEALDSLLRGAQIACIYDRAEHGRFRMYFLGPESFDEMTDTDLLAWLEAVESTYGEGAAIELGQQLNLTDRLEGSGLNPEYVAKVKDHISKGHARVQAKTMIQDIGMSIGTAADKLVEGALEPVLEAPHMEPDFVWAISRAYWHEIVHRGMELGRYDAMWIKGIKEFSYDEVLVFAQHIWAAFKRVTFLDFTIPHESHIIKSWLSISEKWSEREHAPDVSDDTIENKEKRLQDYIDYGGPSHALTLGGVDDPKALRDEGVSPEVGYDGPNLGTAV